MEHSKYSRERIKTWSVTELNKEIDELDFLGRKGKQIAKYIVKLIKRKKFPTGIHKFTCELPKKDIVELVDEIYEFWVALLLNMPDEDFDFSYGECLSSSDKKADAILGLSVYGHETSGVLLWKKYDLWVKFACSGWADLDSRIEAFIQNFNSMAEKVMRERRIEAMKNSPQKVCPITRSYCEKGHTEATLTATGGCDAQWCGPWGEYIRRFSDSC